MNTPIRITYTEKDNRTKKFSWKKYVENVMENISSIFSGYKLATGGSPYEEVGEAPRILGTWDFKDGMWVNGENTDIPCMHITVSEDDVSNPESFMTIKS